MQINNSAFFSITQNFSVCLGNALAKKTVEDSKDTFVHYLGNGFGIPRHFAERYDLVFKQLRLLVLPNYAYETLNRVKRKTLFLSLITWFGIWFWFWFWLTSEAFTRKCSLKTVFLEISQNSQENTCAGASFSIKFNKFLKKRLWRRCFPVNFVKFLRTSFLHNTSGGYFYHLIVFLISIN